MESNLYKRHRTQLWEQNRILLLKIVAFLRATFPSTLKRDLDIEK